MNDLTDLVQVIVQMADDAGSVPRDSLRDEWARRHPEAGSRYYQPPTHINDFGVAHAGRWQNRDTEMKVRARGLRWDTKKAKRHSHGRESSENMRRILVQLEYLGAAKRIDDRVQVLDWTIMLDLLNADA